ncbi:unnamed protein product, partial [Heterotrigona itama]
IVRSGGRLLGAAQGSAGTGPAAIPDGNLIRDADIFVPRRDWPKNEQNLIHNEPKAVSDRFTSHSRFGEIYNGKRGYRGALGRDAP